MVGPTTEKDLFCAVAVRAKGTQISLRVVERKEQRPRVAGTAKSSHKSAFHCCLPQLRQIHSSSFMYFIHPFFLGRPLFLLPSSHAINHHFLFQSF